LDFVNVFIKNPKNVAFSIWWIQNFFLSFGIQKVHPFIIKISKNMKQKILLSIFIFLIAAGGFAQSGEITVTSVQQRIDGSGLVDVYFNLNGPANFYFIKLRVKFGSETSYFPVAQNTFSGDIGPISSGNNKHIVWDPTLEHPNRYSPQTNLMLIAYNNIEGFNPCPSEPTVYDYDGNIYNTVLIGNQCWMASNLNTTRDANGISVIRYCYSNSEDYCELYGGLYTWGTVMNGAASSSANPSGVQGICPTGWHVPSDAEWTQLTNYLINTYVDITTDNVGNKLKSCRQVSSPLNGDCNTSQHPRWNSIATQFGTNDFGFSALPGGYRNNSGNYIYLGMRGYWWSATHHVPPSYSWLRLLSYDNGYMIRDNGLNYYYSSYGFSVRCIRD